MNPRLFALALLGVGCRPSADASGTPDDDGPGSGGSSVVEPASTSANVEASDGADETSELEPGEGWTAALEGSACELGCADVYACLVVEGQEPAAASTIELGCLDACVRSPAGFASCARPDPIDAPRCGEYLGCVRGAWPDGDRPAIVIEAPIDGCAVICAAFAACVSDDDLGVSSCANQCRAELDPATQLAAAECTKLDGCPAIEACIMSIPGA